MAAPVIRPVRDPDVDAVTAIYNHYIAESVATFEEVAITAAEMRRRISDVSGRSLPWLVAEREGEVVGYAYASPWRPRSAYRYSVESTVYLSPEHLGQGIGEVLYRELFARLRECEVHVVIGGISLPNSASIRLHEKMGMHKVAHLEQVGFKFGRWVDVGYWEIVLGA